MARTLSPLTGKGDSSVRCTLMVAVNNWHLGDLRNVHSLGVEGDFLHKFRKGWKRIMTL